MTTDTPLDTISEPGDEWSFDPAGLRLFVPPDIEHTRLVRSLLRALITFRDEESESRFLVATTEIVVNAVEATRRAAGGQRGSAGSVVIEIPPPPIRHVDVCDTAGGSGPGTTDTGHLGAGLTIARNLVDELMIHRAGSGTRVRLVLGEAAA